MKQTLDVTARKETLEEAASRELNSSYAIVVDGELAYQHAAMLNMFRKGAEWQAQQSPWISVKDRLPEEDGYYLVTDGNFIVTAYFFKDWKKFAQYKRYPHPFYGDGVIKLYMPIPKFN